MTKRAYPGILQFDGTTLTFHADPSYCRPGQDNQLITITGLNDYDPATEQLNLDASQCRRPAKALQVRERPNPPMPIGPIYQGSYANLLYPIQVTSIMGSVLTGKWDGPDPEKCIDALIAAWIDENVSDHKLYITNLVGAVQQRGCIDIVVARLDAYTLAAPDQGDHITICRGRRARLPGESGGAGHPIDDLPMINFHDPDGNTPDYEAVFTYAETQAETFYIHADRYELRPPTINLSDALKDQIRTHLSEAGYRLSTDTNAAFTELEKILRSRDMEQMTLSRLLFLALVDALNGIDGQASLRLLPNANPTTPPVLPKQRPTSVTHHRAETNMKPKIVHDETIGDYRVRLTATGKLLVSYKSSQDKSYPWYKDPTTRQPWIPRKESFLALVNQAIRDGRFTK